MAQNGLNGTHDDLLHTGTGTGSCPAERKWARPDLPSKCTYVAGVTTIADSPHRHLSRYGMF